MGKRIECMWDHPDEPSYEVPDKCPLCKMPVLPAEIIKKLVDDLDNEQLGIIYRCPSCLDLFFAYYTKSLTAYEFRLKYIAPKFYKKQKFNSNIQKISPRFIEIFNQSAYAHSLGLNEVAGPGYRKALEILIKDYLKSLNIKPESKLIKAIDQIENEKLKTFAHGSRILGNEEAHYQKYLQSDISVLEKTIKAVIKHIEDEIFYKETDDLVKSKQKQR